MTLAQRARARADAAASFRLTGALVGRRRRGGDGVRSRAAVAKAALFGRLFRGGESRAAVAKARGPRITELQDAQDAAWRDDYAASQALRRAHRAERRREFTQRAADDARGIRVKLRPEDPRDAAALAAVEFDAPRRRSDAARGEKRMRLLEGPIFDGSAAKPADA